METLFVPAEPNDERVLNVRVTGDLGSDGGTVAATHSTISRAVNQYLLHDGDVSTLIASCHRIRNSSARFSMQIKGMM